MVRFVTFPPKSRNFLIAACLLTGVVILFGISLSPRYIKTGVLEGLSMGRSEDVSSLTGRLPLWEALMDDIKRRPQGHGYLAYWNKRQIEEFGDRFHWEIPHGHNLYLDVMIDGGLLRLLLLLLLYGTIYRRTRLPGVAFALGLLSYCVIHGFGESLFKLPTFAAFSITVVVIRLSLWDKSEESIHEKQLSPSAPDQHTLESECAPC